METRWSGGNKLLPLAAGIGAAVIGREAWRRARQADLQGQVALVTGGSRGLGLLLAREFARQGCRVAICARDEAELERAGQGLAETGAQVLAVRCDVADRADVERLVDEVTRQFGRVDILVNNAGIIEVGPLPTMTLADFEAAMGVMFWGVLYPTLAVLPRMRERRRGSIVNITSIGGKVSVPHLLPYGAAKFAAVGLSEGLGAELAGTGIRVTTVAPGLMRTGSYVNASFKGHHNAEFTWFALGASLPLVSMDAERAARQIVAATKRGDAEVILSLPAAVLARVHGLFPGLTADVLGLVNRVLPAAPSESGRRSERGVEIQAGMDSELLRVLTAWGHAAAQRFDEFPGARSTVAGGQDEQPAPAGEPSQETGAPTANGPSVAP